MHCAKTSNRRHHMFDLFKNELHHFKKIAFIFGLVLTVCWAYASTSIPLTEMKTMKTFSVYLIVITASFIFGATQMYLHRRKAQWTCLVHRPIATNNIHLSLLGAGVLLLMTAIILPLIIVTLGYDATTNMVIEGRYYLWILHLLLVTISSYFIGTYVILSPHKAAILSFSWIILITSSRDIISSDVLIGLDVLTLCITFFLSRISFKVDLTTQFSDKRLVLFSALVLQPWFTAIIILMQVTYYHFPLMLIDKHPDQYPQGQHAGYYSEVWRLKAPQLAEKFIDDAHPQKEQLVKRLEKAEIERLRTRFTPQQLIGQIQHQDKQFALNDSANKTQWVFSHRKGVLVGHHLITDEPVGFVGAQGFLAADALISEQDRFGGVPSVLFNKFIQTNDTIYVVDFSQREIEIKHQLTNGEQYQSNVAPQQSGDYYLVISDKSLYAFDYGRFDEANEYTHPAYVIEHPYPYNPTLTILYTDLIDGYLLHYQSRILHGYKKPGYGLLYVKHDGSSELLATHSFKGYRPIPSWISTQDYWISPIVVGLGYRYLESLTRPSYKDSFMSIDEVFEAYPPQTYYLILFAAIFSSLITLLLARKIKLSTSNTLMWCILNLICALPGLLAFFFMTNWREALFAAKHSPN